MAMDFRARAAKFLNSRKVLAPKKPVRAKTAGPSESLPLAQSVAPPFNITLNHTQQHITNSVLLGAPSKVNDEGESEGNLLFRLNDNIKAPARQQLLGFLDLPAEIRLMIYGLLFIRAGTLIWNDQRRLSAQMLRVNRTIWNEAASVLYGRNRFRFDGIPYTSPSVAGPFSSRRPCRSIELSSYSIPSFRGRTLRERNRLFHEIAQNLTGLKILVLGHTTILKYNSFHVPYEPPRWKFPDMSIIRNVIRELPWLAQTFEDPSSERIKFTIEGGKADGKFTLFDIEDEFDQYRESVSFKLSMSWEERRRQMR